MERIKKEDVIKLMADLKAKGYTSEELAVMLQRTTQSIWAWRSKATKRIPCKSDWEVLNHLLKK